MSPNLETTIFRIKATTKYTNVSLVLKSKKSHAKELEECLFIRVCRQLDIGGALLWQETFWGGIKRQLLRFTMVNLALIFLTVVKGLYHS